MNFFLIDPNFMQAIVYKAINHVKNVGSIKIFNMYCNQMQQQLKCSNKININESDLLPVKLAFQANIFKYVQKKKRELLVFTQAKSKQNQKEKHPSRSSNLINRNSNLKFYNPNCSPLVDSDILLSARIKLTDRRSQYIQSNKKNKSKSHKSTLSDWRALYVERNDIAQKHQIKKGSPEKMAVTDRLFYPVKKQSQSSLECVCEKHNQNNPKVSDIKQKYFVSDQNFYHMYHRSVTPIPSDLAERKRIEKYLNLNKERRQSRHGLRLMNEGISSDLTCNNQGNQKFVPYKLQSSQSNSKSNLIKDSTQKDKIVCLNRPNLSMTIQADHSLQIVGYNKTQIQRLSRFSQLSVQKLNIEQNIIQDPEQAKAKEKLQYKNYINLSELFNRTIDPSSYRKGEFKELRFKLFKPKQNKVQKGIFNAKASQTLAHK